MIAIYIVNIETETCLRQPLSQEHVERPDLSHAHVWRCLLCHRFGKTCAGPRRLKTCHPLQDGRQDLPCTRPDILPISQSEPLLQHHALTPEICMLLEEQSSSPGSPSLVVKPSGLCTRRSKVPATALARVFRIARGSSRYSPVSEV